MIIRGEFSYKKAIILTSERLLEINTFLEKNYSKIFYEGKCKDGSNIEFANVEELLEHRNHKKNKLTRVTIVARDELYKEKLSISFEAVRSFFLLLKRSVEVEYFTETIESKTILVKTFQDLFDRSKAKYWYLVKFSTLFYFYLLSLVVYIIQAINYFTNAQNDSTSTTQISSFSITHWSLMIILIGLLLSALFGLDKLITQAFPRVVFSWGEELQNDSRRQRSREQLFWIIVSIIFGSLITFILNKIWIF